MKAIKKHHELWNAVLAVIAFGMSVLIAIEGFHFGKWVKYFFG